MSRDASSESGESSQFAHDDSAPRQEILQPHAAARRASGRADLVAPGERQQQEPGVLEGYARGRMQLDVGLVGLAEQRTRIERAEPIPRLEAQGGCAQQSVHA